MKLLIFSVVLIFASVYSLEIAKLNDDDDDGVYQIEDGDCYSALARDLVYHEHVHKTRLPFVTREATSSWSGNQTIYCLRVLNDKDVSKGSTCKVAKGGVGYNNVTVEMHSEKNHGLEFDVQVYAR